MCAFAFFSPIYALQINKILCRKELPWSCQDHFSKGNPQLLHCHSISWAFEGAGGQLWLSWVTGRDRENLAGKQKCWDICGYQVSLVKSVKFDSGSSWKLSVLLIWIHIQLNQFSDPSDLSGDCVSIHAGARGEVAEGFHNFATQRCRFRLIWSHSWGCMLNIKGDQYGDLFSNN